MLRNIVAGLFVLLFYPGVGNAVEYKQVLPNESRVQFAYTQMGVPMEGRFNKFAASVIFDPAHLDKAQAKVDIDIASIDTGSTEANQEVVRKPWFDAATYPVASFASTGVKALGGNRYEVSGKMTIKGRTRAVLVPATFTAAGARGQFYGVLPIKRLDYAIGEGEWADVSAVADEIRIKFHLVMPASTSGKK